MESEFEKVEISDNIFDAAQNQSFDVLLGMYPRYSITIDFIIYIFLDLFKVAFMVSF
jgi:hypothetical protein